MFDFPMDDAVQAAPQKPLLAQCEPVATIAGYGAGQCSRGPNHLLRAGPVTSEDLEDFIHDPEAFAERAGAPKPEVFIKAYLQGLETRLAGVVGAPKAAPQRLATLTADTLAGPTADCFEHDATRIGDPFDGLDLAPRMGPVVVACAVVTAVTAVVQAAVAVATVMSNKHMNA